MDWKQSILTQLQEKNRLERDVYSDIVKHCESFKGGKFNNLEEKMISR